MPTNFIGVLLSNSPNYTVNTGFATQLYDAEGNQTVTVQAGASLSLVGSLGANTVRLAGNASSWQVYHDVSTALFIHTDGSRVEMSANTVAQTLQFDDRSLDLRINTSGATPEVVLGSQTLVTSATAIAPASSTPTDPPVSGNTMKTAWTLLWLAQSGQPLSGSSFKELFASDGTASGTGSLLSPTLSGAKLISNSDKTAAVLQAQHDGVSYTYKAWGTDGTVAGTQLLAENISLSYTPYLIGNKIIIPDGGSTNLSGLITDGTVAGTTAVADLRGGIVDTPNQAIWTGVSTVPYGSELFRTVISNSGATASMVRDIYSGSSGGYQSGGVLLPNGKLVFIANDGVHGNEPWVSDGTEAGTFMLADFNVPNYFYSGPGQLTPLGGKVTFSTFVSGGLIGSQVVEAGWDLVFTDGTTSGTTVLDVNPGAGDSFPKILGQDSSLLYFTATAPNVSNVPTLGMYSTNGSTFNRLAEINGSASLLGWNASKAFFSVSDASHGAELWAADLVNGGFALVKDILAGTGSALGAAKASNSYMVGGKLVFTAYTSESAQGLFLSDGTEAGTFQIGSSLPKQIKILGNRVVFADSTGVHAVDAASMPPVVVDLSASSVTAALQSDTDQAFFLTTTGQLFASTGAAAPNTPLSTNVSQFNVVADDALFFIQSTTNGSVTTQSLWYSDGTVAGTRFIEDLPSGSYDLSNAVALRTPGVALPPDTAAPEFASAMVVGNTLTLTYTDANALDASHPPTASAFTLSGTAATVSSVAVDATAKTVTLTLSAAILGTDVVTVSYTDPGAGNDAAAIQDAAGNDAASLVNRAVINQSVDRMAPLFSGAVVNGNTLTLSYSDANALDATNTPAASAFTLSGTSATVSSVAVNSSARTVSLTLSAAVQVSDVVLLNYADPSTGNDAVAIQDSAGNDASSLVSRSVTNQTVDTVAPVISAATVNGSTLTLSYTDTSPLDASNTPAASAFALAGTTATVSSVAVNGAAKTVTLTLSESVKSTDVVTLNYTDPSAGNDTAAIQDSGGNDAASLAARAVTNQTADNVAPVFASAKVNGNTLTLTYTDASLLDSARAPAASAFTLAGTTATVTSASVNNSFVAGDMGVFDRKSVNLTLSAAVSSTDVITLSYTDPSAGNDVNAIQDAMGNDAASLVNQAVVNATSVKAPWTLLVANNSYGLFSSDGTASGTGYAVSQYLSSPRLIVNPDKTAAVLQTTYDGSSYPYKAWGTDGTASGTQLLAQNISTDYTPYLVGNKIVIADGGSTSRSGLITDGTVAGTTVVADLQSGIVDATNQVIWNSVSTVPYGSELFRTVISSAGATTSMVKDIYSGSSGGYSGNSGYNALLPDGKLVFRANDGLHGNEAWVSDSTEAGTFMLVDLYPYSTEGSNPDSFTSFSDKVVFSAYTPGAGYELVLTDGTTAGTSVLDVNPGGSSYPAFLGQANGLLYFTATAPNASNVSTLGMYSTNGSTFNRLADINSSASLLGWNASKAYFKVSDATHGAELWAADLVNGGFALVKDILAGTGSALGATTASNSYMVGGRLAFTAFTSASAQGLFLSDGTEAGTFQIGNGLPSQTKTLGNRVVFADSTGVHAVDAASTTPVVIDLTASSVTAALQSDTDQAFFLTTAGELFVSTGAAAPTTPLSTNVSQFKVVAEDALFFVQSTTSGTVTTQSLWYSDGTVAGTRFIEDLPSGSYDLSNAVALRTPGVALPPDTKAPEFTSALVIGNTLTLTYTDANALDASHPPTASAFALSGTAATVSSVAVDATAKTVTLTLSAPVLGTDVVTVSYTDLTSGNDAAAIQDAAGNDAASLVNRTVINQSVDRMAPLFSGAVVNGNSLTLSYSDANALDATNTPAASAFNLTGTSATVSSVAVNSNAKTVTLALSAAVQVSDVVLLNYADPTTGNDTAAIQDSAGNDASSLVSRPVTNQTVDTLAPVISAVSVNGSTLTLTYTDTSPLDASNTPAASAFALAGTTATVSSVAVNGVAKTVTLTLSQSVKSTDVVTLNYTDPTAGNDTAAIQDSAGNDAASLAARAVTNLTADNIAPVFGSARVNGNTLTLTYTDASLLDSARAPAASAFTLAGTTATVTAASVNSGASGLKNVRLF